MVRIQTNGLWEDLGGDFEAPRGVALADDDTLYVVDNSLYRVRRRAPTGVWADVTDTGNSTGGFASPQGIDVTLDGTLCVADATLGGVRRLSPGSSWGDVLDSASSTGDLGGATGVAVGPLGALYVTLPGRVRTLATGGTWGNVVDTAASAGGFASAVGIAVMSDGALYVADRRSARKRIQRTLRYFCAGVWVAHRRVLSRRRLAYGQSRSESQTAAKNRQRTQIRFWRIV